MGNCIKRCNRPEMEARFDQEQESVGKEDPEFLLPKDEESRKLGGMRVKIVLTKEELQMLMVELKNKEEEEGKKRSLDDVLDEIERVRRRSVNVSAVSSSSWKPSLESIAETDNSEKAIC